MATMKRLPKLWPSRPSPSEKRYSNSRDISGSASASAAMFLRMSPGGSTPSSRWSAPGAAAVVGDRDDGGDVAGVLLEAAQQRREAGAAADGDDLRAAAQVAVVVDDVDDALVALRA